VVVTPVARYMILCEEVTPDPIRPQVVNISYLMSSVTSQEDPPYPLVRSTILVFLVLTDCRGRGAGRIRIVNADDELERELSHSPDFPLDFSHTTPLELVGVSFRLNGCRFPSPGTYRVQFWYNSVMVEERLLRLK
jgi:hypothetical protein